MWNLFWHETYDALKKKDMEKTIKRDGALEQKKEKLRNYVQVLVVFY